MRSFVLAMFYLVATTTACHRGNAIDRPCEEDEQCGSGYDCYNRVCTPVCTAQDQCPADRTCYRHRCMKAPHANVGRNDARHPPQPKPSAPRREGEPLPATAHTPSQGGATVPVAVQTPDVISAELRAMRRELEDIRRNQAATVELIKSKCK